MKNKQILVSAIAVSLGVVGALAGVIHADSIKQQAPTPVVTTTSNDTADKITDQKDANGQDLETNDDQIGTTQTSGTIKQDGEGQDDKNTTNDANEKPDSGANQETGD